MANELFGTPKPERSTMSRIGAALGGFGAGVQGKGPEYLTGLQERRAEEEKKRLAAMVKDAKQAYDFLNRGDVNNAMSLIQDRVQMINKLGGDPADTARIGAMIASGSTEEAKNQLENFLRPFMPTEVIKANEITDSGQIMKRNPLTGEITAEDVAGFRRSATEPSTVQALRYRATQAGLEEGTPEYQEFMRSGGGGSMEGSSGITKYKNGVAVQYLGAGRTRVLDPILGEITDPIQRQRVIEEAIASGPAEAGAVAAAQTQARGEEERAQNIITEGMAAADSTAVLRRSLELLNRVSTGGFNRVSFAAKKLFGVEGADEGELSANLGKAVLSQLRATFGAAFTEREGARLEGIEAGFGSNVDTNKRLLNNALTIAERSAQRAIRRAEQRGDYETADEIEAALDFNLAEIEAAFAEDSNDGVQPPTTSAGKFIYDPVTKRLLPQEK